MKAILIISFFTICSFTHGQSPNWLWAKGIGGNYGDEGLSVTVDVNGNVYVTGSFTSQTITFGTITLINSGSWEDIFLVKYSPSGNVIWAKSAGGIFGEHGMGVTTDDSCNVFVTGYFQSSTIIFGSDTLSNSGGTDMFLVKYSPSGNILWAKKAGGTDWDYGYGVSTDAGGNVYVTGYFKSSSITFGTNTLNNYGSYDIFLAKYSSSGAVLWVKRAGGSGWDAGRSISTDANDNVLLTGYFESTAVIFGTDTLNSTSYRNIFVVKYDSLGNAIWAKSPIGNYDDIGYSISTDTSNNVFVTGYFSSSPLNFGANTLTTVGAQDIFLAKYSPSGNNLWAKSAGGNAYDIGFGVANDISGNSFVTGYFNSSSIIFGATTLTPIGSSDIFVVKYDTLGNILWAIKAGGSSVDIGTSIFTDANSNSIITGDYSSSTLSFGTNTLFNAGGSDIFIAKLDSTGNVNGIVPLEFKFTGNIYPNPFSTTTTLQTNKFLKNATLTIYNSFGQQVKQIKNISGQTITLHRDNLASGLYYIRLTQDNKTFSADKLIITDK